MPFIVHHTALLAAGHIIFNVIWFALEPSRLIVTHKLPLMIILCSKF